MKISRFGSSSSLFVEDFSLDILYLLARARSFLNSGNVRILVIVSVINIPHFYDQFIYRL